MLKLGSSILQSTLSNKFQFNKQYTVLDNGTATNWGTNQCTTSQVATGVKLMASGADLEPLIYKSYVHSESNFPFEVSCEFATFGVALTIKIMIWSTNFSKRFTAEKGGQVIGKNVIRFDEADFTDGGTGMTWEEAGWISFSVYPQSGVTAEVTMNHIYTGVTDNTSVILSFDDGLDSMYDTVEPILRAKGYKGTFYITPAWLDGASQFMTTEQVQELYSKGHDIGNHGYNHLSALGQTSEAIEGDIQDFIDWADTNNIPRAKLHYAYPDGVINANANTAVANKGILTGRSIIAGYNSGQGNSKYLYTILVMQTTTLQDLKDAYNKAKSLGCSVQYTIHNVIETPTQSVDVSISIFQDFINWLYTQKAKVLSISEYYNKII